MFYYRIDQTVHTAGRPPQLTSVKLQLIHLNGILFGHGECFVSGKHAGRRSVFAVVTAW